MSTVVHIGYHKTGTTALQRTFFPRLPGCRFLTHGGRYGRSVFRQLCENLMKADDADFFEDTMRVFLRDARPPDPEVLVLSHEGLSGQVFEGAYNRERNARRLRAVVPDGRILVVVRSQAGMLRSLYGQHLRHGGFDTFEEFVTNRRPGGDVIDLDHLCYDDVVTLYRELFGPDAVGVLAYESLTRDPAAFLVDLCEAVGVPPPPGEELQLPHVNRSLTAPSRWVLRHGNRLFRRTTLNPSPRLPLKPAEDLWRHLDRIDPKLFPNRSRLLSDRDERFLADLVRRYEPSNARLASITGLPLDGLGYPLPAGAAAVAP